ncbi:Uncharacterised protein [Candidatus Tiddalikarchaeum anstoanum]|nr:Uncharacterised protein [Candidatus Tiddalikarchaeum anstoanum]
MEKLYSCNECMAPILITGLSGLEKIALQESKDTKAKPTKVDYKNKTNAKCIYCRSPINL